MASLRILRNKYYARVRKWDGIKQIEKLVPLKTSNRIEALERMIIVNKYENDIKNGININFPWMNEKGRIIVIRYTLEKAIDEYISAREGEKLSKGTIDIYKGALMKFSRVCGKNIPIENVSSRHIELFKLLFQTNSNEFTNINLRSVKTFLNWLSYNEIINETIRIKLIKIPKKLPTYFNDKEWNSILELKIDDERNKLGNLKYPEIKHYQRAWDFYYKTGCRLSEPFNGILDGHWLIIDEDGSKTNIQREIYIPEDIKGILIEMHQRLKNHLLKHNSSTDFIKRYSRVFKQCCRLVGIDDKHFHHIRHTYAVRRYLETRDIYRVAKELGHSSVTTTEIYAKFNLSKLEQDFPSFTNIYNKGYINTKYGIRDTDFRDTLHIQSSIARG